jgi:hypothetical protein
LGEIDAAGRVALEPRGDGQLRAQQQALYEHGTAEAPHWVEVDLKRVRVERTREFGGPWLGLRLLHRLELMPFLQALLPRDRADVPWASVVAALVLGRLCAPSSELRMAEHWYEATALPDLLGVPAAKVNDDRLYRFHQRPVAVALPVPPAIAPSQVHSRQSYARQLTLVQRATLHYIAILDHHRAFPLQSRK